MNIKKAETILDLLEEYLECADQWEAHRKAVIDGKFGKAEERTAHLLIQAEHLLPLMERCKAEDVAYSLLMDIIPGSFKTTSDERWEILEDLYRDAGVARQLDMF